MQKKIKVTYLLAGQMQQKIIWSQGWYNLPNDLINANIMQDNILKIEVVLEASDVIDTTL